MRRSLLFLAWLLAVVLVAAGCGQDGGRSDAVAPGGAATFPVTLDTPAGTLTLDTGGTSLDALMLGLRDIRPTNIVGIQVPSEPVMVGGIAYIYPLEASTGMFQALAEDNLEEWVAANPQWVNNL